LKIAAISIFTLLLLASSVTANGVELSLSSKNIVGYGGEATSIDLIIKNNQIAADTFTITVFPSKFDKVTTNLEKFSVWINSSSTEKVKLFFDMPMDVDEIGIAFKVSVKSVTDSSVTDEKELVLETIRKTDVYIDKIISPLENSKYDPEEVVDINVKIRNVGLSLSGKYELDTTVENPSGTNKTIYNNVLNSILPKTDQKISNIYKIGKYDEPGIYKVQAVLEDSDGKIISSETTTFNVNSVYELPEEYTTKRTSYNFFFITTTVTVKNDGNINTPSFYITESAPAFGKLIFNPEIEPTKVVKSDDGRVVYKWLIPTLEPNKSVTIKYSYDLWEIWVTLFVLIAAGYFSVKFLYTPTLVKKHRHRGPITKEKEILVSLEVKNRTMHEVKDVIIRDIVPTIAKVVEKFDTLKPMMRQTSVGTELRWKIDALKPREERVITYRIKPVVETAESLNLPKAHARYMDRKKIKRIIASKSVLVKG
jgi:hypothetical protein